MTDINRVRTQNSVSGDLDQEEELRGGTPTKKQIKLTESQQVNETTLLLQHEVESDEEDTQEFYDNENFNEDYGQMQEEINKMKTMIVELNQNIAQRDMYMKSREKLFLKLLTYTSVPTYQHGNSYGTSALQNLGNTCFLNAVIQCLTKVTPLKEYMLYQENQFNGDFNNTNRLGYDGEIALIMKNVFQNMYNPKFTHFSPRALKFVIGKHKTEFQGDDQHDAMEFASFIINGIHEDLNRASLARMTKEELDAHRKEHQPRDDSEDYKLPVGEQAALSWKNYSEKNSSIINDHFAGQHVHTVTCQNCQKMSYNFQAYNSIHVPIAKKSMLPFIFLSSKYEISFNQFEVTAGWDIGQLRAYIANQYKIPLYEIIIVDVYEGGPYDIFSDERSPQIADLNLYVYHLPGINVTPTQYESNAFPDFYVVQFYVNNLSKHSIPIFVSRTADILITDVLKNIASFINFSRENITYFSLLESTCERIIYEDATQKVNILENVHKHIAEGTAMPSGSTISIIAQAEDFPAQKGYMIHVHLKSTSLLHVVKFNKIYNPSEHLKKLQTPPIPLSDCINKMLEPETMDGDNRRTCPHCAERTRSVRTLHFWTLPNVIVLQLNRFYYEYMECHKINDVISYPLDNLEFFEMKTSSTQSYELIGVTSHLGVRPDYGHYVSYARTVEGDGKTSWHKYDDECKTVFPRSAVETIPEAYVLFYQKKNMDVPHPASKTIMLQQNSVQLTVDIQYNDTMDYSMGLPLSPGVTPQSHESLSINNMQASPFVKPQLDTSFVDDDDDEDEDDDELDDGEFKPDTMQDDDDFAIGPIAPGGMDLSPTQKKAVVTRTLHVHPDMTIHSLCLNINHLEGIPPTYMLIRFDKTDNMEEVFLDPSDETTTLSKYWHYIQAQHHLQLEICDPYLAKFQTSLST